MVENAANALMNKTTIQSTISNEKFEHELLLNEFAVRASSDLHSGLLHGTSHLLLGFVLVRT